jgi:hypothetical protein
LLIRVSGIFVRASRKVGQKCPILRANRDLVTQQEHGGMSAGRQRHRDQGASKRSPDEQIDIRGFLLRCRTAPYSYGDVPAGRKRMTAMWV